MDRLLAQQDLDGSGRIYQYNPLGDVTGIHHIPAPLAEPGLDGKDSAEPHTPLVHHFERDALGRLIRKRTDAGVTEYAYDNADNLLTINFTNVQGEEQCLDYTYDALGQLLSETNSAGLLQYQYDELGNLETLTLPDQRQLNHLYYGSGHLHQINLGGLPEQLTDTDGSTVWHSEYQAWGRTRNEWHDQQPGREQNLRFQGQYLDRETGLHYNTFRFFDPDVGRFTQSDPIGLMGGINLYIYAPNPTGWIDPLGLTTGTTEGGMSRTTPTWRDRYGPASMRDHHLIPQAMMKDEAFLTQMKKAGIPDPENHIHRQISRVPNAQHSNIHKSGWNQQWKNWFAENPDFKKSDLQRNIKNVMRQYNIPKSSRTFAKKYGCK